jgi:hypothetical protein
MVAVVRGADRRSPGARGRLPQRRHQRPRRLDAGRGRDDALGGALLRSAAPVDAAAAALRRPRRPPHARAGVRLRRDGRRAARARRADRPRPRASSAWPRAHRAGPAAAAGIACATRSGWPQALAPRTTDGWAAIRDIMDIRPPTDRAARQKETSWPISPTDRVDKPWDTTTGPRPTATSAVIHVNKGTRSASQYTEEGRRFFARGLLLFRSAARRQLSSARCGRRQHRAAHRHRDRRRGLRHFEARRLSSTTSSGSKIATAGRDVGASSAKRGCGRVRPRRARSRPAGAQAAPAAIRCRPASRTCETSLTRLAR